MQPWGVSSSQSNNIRYNEFGLEGYTENSAYDFAGAYGAHGWPNVELDMNNPLNTYLPFIPEIHLLQSNQRLE